jgi:hypothetical protein
MWRRNPYTTQPAPESGPDTFPPGGEAGIKSNPNLSAREGNAILGEAGLQENCQVPFKLRIGGAGQHPLEVLGGVPLEIEIQL